MKYDKEMKYHVVYPVGLGPPVTVPAFVCQAGELRPGQAVNAFLSPAERQGLEGTVLVVTPGHGGEKDPAGDAAKARLEEKAKVLEAEKAKALEAEAARVKAEAEGQAKAAGARKAHEKAKVLEAEKAAAAEAEAEARRIAAEAETPPPKPKAKKGGA